MFAQTLVEDYALAPTYHSVITKSIQEQLSDFKAHIASIDTDWRPPAIEIPRSEAQEDQDDSDAEVVHRPQQPPPEHHDDAPEDDEDVVMGRGTLDEDAVKWWDSWRKRAKKEMPTRIVTTNRRKKRKITTKIEDVDEADGKERARTVDELEVDEKKVHEDLRILIKVGSRPDAAGKLLTVPPRQLDIIVGSMKLDDQFEWDLENQDASPEQFAEVYAMELGLGGEFK